MLDYITIDTTSVIIKRRYTINTNVNAVNGLQQKKRANHLKTRKHINAVTKHLTT